MQSRDTFIRILFDISEQRKLTTEERKKRVQSAMETQQEKEGNDTKKEKTEDTRFNLIENRTTVLNWAVEYNLVDLVKFLLDRGANPDVADYYGSTPLIKAAQNGRVAIINLDKYSLCAGKQQNKLQQFQCD